MNKIHCPQKNTSIDSEPKKNLMQALLDHGIPVASSCQGDGICGKCRMLVQAETELPPPSELEQKTLQKAQAKAKERLSCQLKADFAGTVKTTYW